MTVARNIFRRLIFLILTAGITACSGFDMFSPTSTVIPTFVTPTIVQTPTATRDWFPATATPQPQSQKPTLTPTTDLRPIMNSILIEDDFSSQGRWTTPLLNTGSIAYGNQELTIAINQERQSLYSFFLEPVPNNYFMEIQVNPSLCQGEDMYGIAFRVQGNSDFYRLVLRCDGQVRVDLVRGGGVVPITELTYSGHLRPGTMQDATVAIWTNGVEVQIFINDAFQFSLKNLMWTSGGIGVFARSGEETALTVNFSDFIVREGRSFPATPVATWTALPSPTKTPLKRP